SLRFEQQEKFLTWFSFGCVKRLLMIFFVLMERKAAKTPARPRKAKPPGADNNKKINTAYSIN
ncbi:hypothetical protein V7128_23380, partial [Neobacillus vireti]|uniref:hypothetical protein n=1 Tax=Neobacillus vireti TaxID=220686 RepID=UPI003000555C